MNELDNVEKGFKDLEKYKSNAEDKIYELLLDILSEDDYDEESIKKEFPIWLNDEGWEFSFNYHFGNIDFEELLKMHKGFKEKGYLLKSIISNDIYKDKKGFNICFVKEEVKDE